MEKRGRQINKKDREAENCGPHDRLGSPRRAASARRTGTPIRAASSPIPWLTLLAISSPRDHGRLLGACVTPSIPVPPLPANPATPGRLELRSDLLNSHSTCTEWASPGPGSRVSRGLKWGGHLPFCSGRTVSAQCSVPVVRDAANLADHCPNPKLADWIQESDTGGCPLPGLFLVCVDALVASMRQSSTFPRE